MNYTKVIFASFSVPTVAFTSQDKAIYQIPHQRLSQASQLNFGNNSSFSTDLQAKIERMTNSIYFAKEKLKTLHLDKPEVLKVFIVPEFYFRPGNRKSGGYTEEESDAITQYLYNHMVNIYPDWFLLGGTIIFNKKEDVIVKQKSLTSKVGITAANKKQVHNLGFSIFGGSSKLNGKGKRIKNWTLSKMEKAYASAIDGIAVDEAAQTYNAETMLGIDNFKHHIQEVAGVKIAMEICLEHQMSFLKNAYAGDTSC